MKKVVRTVWISVLTGMAFLVACNPQNRLNKAEKKQQENIAIVPEEPRLPDSAVIRLNEERAALAAEIDSIRASKSYGNKRLPSQRSKLYKKELFLLSKIYDIDIILDNGKADSTQAVIDSIRRQSTPSTVYGPPR